MSLCRVSFLSSLVFLLSPCLLSPFLLFICLHHLRGLLSVCYIFFIPSFCLYVLPLCLLSYFYSQICLCSCLLILFFCHLSFCFYEYVLMSRWHLCLFIPLSLPHSVSQSLYHSVSLSLSLSICLSSSLPVSPSLSVSLPFYPSDSFYFCLSPSTSVFVNLHLSLSLFICLPPSPSVSLSLTCIKFCLDKDRWITVETGGPTSVHFCKFTCVPLSFTSTLYHAPGGWEGGVAGGGAGQLRHQQAEEHLCHAVSLSLSIALSRRFLLLSRGFTKPDRQSLFIQICFNLNKGSFLTFPQC